MVRWLMGLIGALGLILPAQAVDAPRTDAFVAQVAGSNLFEIESSKLAKTRTKTETVLAFADKMVSDHGSAAVKFKQARADAKLKAPPDALDPKHKAVVDDLHKKNGEAFDKTYIEAQYKAHREIVELFQAYATAGQNRRMKQFAQEMLPTLRAHLELISKMR